MTEHELFKELIRNIGRTALTEGETFRLRNTELMETYGVVCQLFSTICPVFMNWLAQTGHCCCKWDMRESLVDRKGIAYEIIQGSIKSG